MKKTITLVACLGLSLGASAKLTTPAYFSSDFAGEFAGGLTWQTYGVDDKPAGTFAENFGKYSATHAYEILNIEQAYVAFSPSQFATVDASDQWLITPEVEIPADKAIVSFAPSVYGSRLKNNFKALLSTSGADKADFTTSIVSSNLKGNGNELTSIQRAHAISGYKGQKVRLALVGYGNTAGMFGFRDIVIAPYFLKVDKPEQYDDIVLIGNNGKLSMTVSLATVDEVKGFTAELKTANGYTDRYVSTTTISNPAITTETFTFPGMIDLGSEITSDYTVTITPNYAGAEPSVITGRMTVPRLLYHRPAVIEEMTGIWCQYCPYGFALLEYLQHKYPAESESFGPCYGIAIHNGDPMAIAAIDAAAQNQAKYFGQTGLPNMVINRIKGLHPQDSPSLVESIVGTTTFLKTEIDHVLFNTNTRHGIVKFSTTQTYSTNDNHFKVLVYVTQNAMSHPGWGQVNRLYTLTAAEITTRFGADAVEFFKPFIERDYGPVYGLDFNDVARAYYPSFEGAAVTYNFKAMEPISGKLEFDLPADVVTDVNNAVITLIMTNAAGEIIAADRKTYADFDTDWSGLTETAAPATKVYAKGGALTVEADEAVVAEVFATDGRMICRKQLAAGLNTVELTALRGVVIVKTTGASGVTTSKIAL